MADRKGSAIDGELDPPIQWLRTALVIGENVGAARRTAAMLLRWGADTVQALASYKQAHKAICAATTTFDVVLCDYDLDDGDATTLLQVLRRRSACKRLVILTQTASSQQCADLIYGWQPDDVLTKPVDSGLLFSRLTTIDAKRHAQAAGWFYRLALLEGAQKATNLVKVAMRDRSLTDAGGNVSEASRSLRINRTYMHKLLAKQT